MAKAKAFIKRHPAWATLVIVVLAGAFMGSKWYEPEAEQENQERIREQQEQLKKERAETAKPMPWAP